MRDYRQELIDATQSLSAGSSIGEYAKLKSQIYRGDVRPNPPGRRATSDEVRAYLTSLEEWENGTGEALTGAEFRQAIDDINLAIFDILLQKIDFGGLTPENSRKLLLFVYRENNRVANIELVNKVQKILEIFA